MNTALSDIEANLEHIRGRIEYRRTEAKKLREDAHAMDIDILNMERVAAEYEAIIAKVQS